ncbi:MAG TPA: hypothetical protein VNS81_12660 [Nocardioides sp.]|nr:hypothetical protein [Nocardioides sp.]
MRPSRPVGIALVVLLVAALVGGPIVGVVALRHDSGDDFAAYCSVVEDRRDEIGAAVAAGPETGLLRALPSFEALQDKAPEDIRDEWAVVTGRIRALRDAFAAAGVDPGSYDRKNPPASVSAKDRAAIETAAVRLGSEETRAALAGVDQQARDVCHTPLSL